MNVTFSHTAKVTPAEFIHLLQRAGYSDKRPVHDTDRIEKMIKNADLIVTAWDTGMLDNVRPVGMARCLTDFAQFCFVTDLLVDAKYQRRGIGRQLLRTVRSLCDENCRIALTGDPDALAFYAKAEMQKADNVFVSA